MKRSAIVILNWNGVDFLKKFLPGLEQNTKLLGAEIIVADNASTDNSLNYLRQNHPKVKLIEHSENHGFAEGYNLALESIDADYFVLLNSDIEVGESWLKPLKEFMDQHEEVAACSPVLLNFHDRKKYEYAGAAGGYIDRFGYTFCRGRLFGRTDEEDKTFSEPREVFWTTGACMMIRAEVFREAGGFDAHFFAHMEEIDLCWRLRNQGHKLAIVPGSKVYHVGGGTLPKSNPFKTYLNFRNNLFLMYKNLPTRKLGQRIFRRKLMDGLSAAMFLVQLKAKDIAAIFRAHRHFSRDRNRYEEFRKDQDKLHSYPELKDIYQRSVVVDYFLLGRRSFSRLRGNYAAYMDNNKIK